MVVLLQVARTPEPAVASTHCIESFDLTEVQDKLEGKEKKKKKEKEGADGFPPFCGHYYPRGWPGNHTNSATLCFAFRLVKIV